MIEIFCVKIAGAISQLLRPVIPTLQQTEKSPLSFTLNPGTGPKLLTETDAIPIISPV